MDSAVAIVAEHWREAMKPCACEDAHTRRRIVMTGGPGAGKTAVLELVRVHFCEHIKVLNEAASIVFGGGFPRSEMRLSARPPSGRFFMFKENWKPWPIWRSPQSSYVIEARSTAPHTGSAMAICGRRLGRRWNKNWDGMTRSSICAVRI